MRFAVPAADSRFHALVVALDQPATPIAQTWRAVGEAAWELGLPRPGVPHDPRAHPRRPSSAGRA